MLVVVSTRFPLGEIVHAARTGVFSLLENRELKESLSSLVEKEAGRVGSRSTSCLLVEGPFIATGAFKGGLLIGFIGFNKGFGGRFEAVATA